MINRKLFPNGESWATGDEALDLKLGVKLNETLANFNFHSISEFYFFAAAIKPRAYNPSFLISIEQMVEAMLFELDSNVFVNFSMKKLKGNYVNRSKVNLKLEKQDIVIDGLKMLNKFRYKDQIDFFLVRNQIEKKNPYTELILKQSEFDLQTKLIFKDLREKIQRKDLNNIEDEFLKELANGSIVSVSGLGEFWFEQDQIFSLNYM